VIHLNEAVIPHYQSEMVPTEKLKTMVALNEAYLREKPTWYMINGSLQYFKVRNDFRLFTEQFFSIFGREIMDLDTVDYSVAYVKNTSRFAPPSEKGYKCGLLSRNFQEIGYNYFLVSELMKPEISSLVSYGDYSFQNLLQFFKDSLTSENYEQIKTFLIKLFISDGFTHEQDRNYHNIAFRVPRIEGISYRRRLHSSVLSQLKNCPKHFDITSDGRILIKDLTPTKVYDNEKIFGTDHRNVFNYSPGQIWRPLFPFSSDTLFQSAEEADRVSNTDFDGLDPNLCSLYFEYPEICKPFFDRLANGDEYRRILERFHGSASQINLTEDAVEHVARICEDKRQAFQKILKI